MRKIRREVTQKLRGIPAPELGLSIDIGIFCAASAAPLGSPPPQRSSRLRSDFECSAARSARYTGPNAASNAVSYAMHYSRSHDAVIRVYDAAGNVIETHDHKGEFKEW
jgi:hypothetical protein